MNQTIEPKQERNRSTEFPLPDRDALSSFPASTSAPPSNVNRGNLLLTLGESVALGLLALSPTLTESLVAGTLGVHLLLKSALTGTLGLGLLDLLSGKKVD